MDRPEKNDFLIDVAAERSYQNQTRAYREAFTEWRNSPKNRFGYRFVHDSREHTYIDGEGFADKQAVTAETRSLHSCLQFLGGIMLMYLVLEVLSILILFMMFDRAHVSWVYFSQRNLNYNVPAEQMLVYCGLRIFSLTAVVTMGNMILKLPRRVVMPHERQKPSLLIYGMCLVIILTLILRLFDYTLSGALSSLKVDSIYYTYFSTSDDLSQCVYFLTELLFMPMLVEIIFRGIILQLFRQFGDGFAILISAIAAACCYHELSKIVFIYILSVALGVFTVKTGSIYPTIALRICTVNLLYLLNSLSLSDNKAAERLTETAIGISIMAVSVFVLHMLRGKYIRPFKLRVDTTELSLRLKLGQMLNSSCTVIWLICSLVAVIVSMRFI